MLPLPHIYVDVSSLLRWTGPASGMMRVESEVAKHALTRPRDATPCFYDISTNRFRAIRGAWVDQLTGWQARLQHPRRSGWTRYLPDRGCVLMALERLRLTTPRPAVANAADRLQRFVLSLRAHRFPIDDERGRRLAIVPFDMAIGEPLRLTRNDVVLSVASDWWQKDAAAIAALKAKQQFGLVVLCYDIIPLLFPHFFPVADVTRFRSHWEGMFRNADLVLVNAKRTQSDIGDYCRSRSMAPPKTAVVPLGCDLPVDRRATAATLRSDLERERYALYVSTIEPRKNHRLLLSVWRRLLEEGIVERARFRLVLVGRRGWMNDDVQSQIDDKDAFLGTLLHIEYVDDAELAVLYANAAFCLYPSLYEGFGLPVVEAFAHGKAVICSQGGALAELVENAAPGLPPDDEEQWYRGMAEWIERPELPRAAAARVARHFQLRVWSEVASEMMVLARGVRSDHASG